MERKRFLIILGIIILFICCIIISFYYYKDKYTITFETGTNETILNQYVGKNSKVKMPITPKKDGYVFIEWQLDGETYNFDEEVKEDTTLTAKWVKEEYIKVNYETNSSYEIETTEILKGSSIDNLPISYKDDFEFIGWYLNDKLYQNEIIYDNVVLTAQYKNEKINTTYKVGDSVLIVGSYSNSSNSTFATNKRAIGWERKIIDIIDGSEFPYMIGDSTGITGFFKANSIEKR